MMIFKRFFLRLNTKTLKCCRNSGINAENELNSHVINSPTFRLKIFNFHSWTQFKTGMFFFKIHTVFLPIHPIIAIFTQVELHVIGFIFQLSKRNNFSIKIKFLSLNVFVTLTFREKRNRAWKLEIFADNSLSQEVGDAKQWSLHFRG